MSDYTLPPVPIACEGWSVTAQSELRTYGHACAEHVRAPILEELNLVKANFNRASKSFAEACSARDEARARIAELEVEIQTLTRECADAEDESGRLEEEHQKECDENERLRARIAELEDQLGITRMCVMCGKSKPASEPREAPGCPPVSDEYGHLCGFDMTPQEAWAHWRKVAHEQRVESDSLRAEVEALRKAGAVLATVVYNATGIVGPLNNAQRECLNNARIRWDAIAARKSEGVDRA